MVQEKELAKRYKGRLTIASGALDFDKADVVLGRLRVECKRTDKEWITFSKEWVRKIEHETSIKDDFAFEIEMQDKKLYVIPENLFRFLEWSLNTPKEEIIKALQEGKNILKGG